MSVYLFVGTSFWFYSLCCFYRLPDPMMAYYPERVMAAFLHTWEKAMSGVTSPYANAGAAAAGDTGSAARIITFRRGSSNGAAVGGTSTIRSEDPETQAEVDREQVLSSQYLPEQRLCVQHSQVCRDGRMCACQDRCITR